MTNARAEGDSERHAVIDAFHAVAETVLVLWISENRP